MIHASRSLWLAVTDIMTPTAGHQAAIALRSINADRLYVEAHHKATLTAEIRGAA